MTSISDSSRIDIDGKEYEISGPMPQFNELVKAAFKVMRNSYSPYSGYKVGAALLARDGRIFSGCNVENASYPVTVCAERSALCSAVSEMGAEKAKGGFTAIALCACDGKEVLPCGMCRQALAEFCADDFKVIPAYIKDNMCVYAVRSLGELIPEVFRLNTES